MSGEYNHTDLPDNALYDRVIHLWNHQKLPHSDERRRQLEREFQSGVFEVLSRWTDDFSKYSGSAEWQPND